MAGDDKATDAEAVDIPEYTDPFPSIADKLQGILDDQRMVGWEIIALATDSVANSNTPTQYPRFRCRYVVMSSDTATTITLNVGTAAYPFEFSGIGPVAFPFPIVIERGINVSFTAQGGADANIYLIGSPE